MDLKKLLSELTLEEKLGQLTQLNAVFFKHDNEADITGPVQNLHITEGDVKYAGSTLNFIGARAMKEIQDAAMAKQPHHIPLLFMQDVIHGYRTIYPIPLAMGCSFDEDLTRDCAKMAAKEAAAAGVHVTFSPMLDLVRDARWGRVMESTGEDKTLNGRLAAAMVQGYQGDGTYRDPENIAACVKHFAAYGAPEAGRDYNSVELSERTLRNEYLPGYRAAVDAGVRMLMPSFNTVGGVPSTANRWLLTDVLRGEWGFDGIVISDYNAYREMVKHGVAENSKEAAALAVNAGCDIEMMSAATYLHAKELLDEGRITMEEIDAAVLRVLQLKEDLGLFENPYRAADEEKEQKLFLSPEHRAICRRAAEESAVLLQNNGVLPFSGDVKKVAVVGPFAAEKGIKGFWACAGRDEECVSVSEGIANLLPRAEITVESGCSYALDEQDCSGIDAAVEAAKAADVTVLCLGEFQNFSGEGNSRADLTLSPAQAELARRVIAANPNTAVVLFCGRPLVLTELSAIAPAILTMWQPGTEGGNAAARLLFGEANPCGKLSMSFPWCVGQEPISYNHLPTGRAVKKPKEITKGGYCSRYQDAPVDPLFVFGHGLSYNTYTYGEVSADREVLRKGETLTVTVKVKNEGGRCGKETVQLYVRDRFASVSRPVKELKDFRKLSFAPGEEKTVRFTLTEEQLRFYGADMILRSEPGDFDVFVGADSDAPLALTFRLE